MTEPYNKIATKIKGVFNSAYAPTLPQDKHYTNSAFAPPIDGNPDIQGGMGPKLDCSIQAITHGVQSVHIINGSIDHALLLELFTDGGIGTMVTNNAALS